MILDFAVHKDKFDLLTNYELFMMPNGIYRAKKIKADNYLYPMYFFKEGDDYITSTSVYALIHYKKRFVRNERFQTTQFYRPSFMTIDKEIMRARTEHRRSSLTITEKDEIIKLGARLIQNYITEMEEKFPKACHILLMGGKDSQNIILAQRKSPWIVLSGDPSASMNKDFIADNNIKIERFVRLANETNNEFLKEEIIASDCMFDPAHFRWVPDIYNIVKEHKENAVIWIGTDGDGIFSKNNNHNDEDYYALHDLHVGTAMGAWHQMLKNFLNVPVLSPYQSPEFLDKLFYQFDPYFVSNAGDVRKDIGRILFGKGVKYPDSNLTPDVWKRSRALSIPRYTSQLNGEGILCEKNIFRSRVINIREHALDFLDRHSNKRRTSLSKALFPLRRACSRVFPVLKNKRHNIAAREIR